MTDEDDDRPQFRCFRCGYVNDLPEPQTSRVVFRDTPTELVARCRRCNADNKIAMT